MKLLLHTCCGPCVIYPLEILRKEGFEVEGYFYNPNIYPQEEFLKRRDVFLSFANSEKLKIHIPEYNEDDYHNALTDNQKPKRCLSCWDLRLLKTAECAKVNNFSVFTTTLLVSPYQDIEALGTIGQRISKDLEVDFLFRDFRPGFRDGHNQAMALGMYCQKYCGCKCSLEERTIKK